MNDGSKKISDKTFTRAELGLPESGFVFCCFNNNYKITPEIFDGWMRILSSVSNSVLWLYKDNDSVPINLYREAKKRGLDPARLIFASRMPLSEHLSRHSAADLFLDTFPCNAHTTASDAIWAGLPILTRQGEAFASRVASSLLHSVGLSDLVVNQQSDYEKLAITIGNSPSLLSKYRRTLQENLVRSSLFDAKCYAKNLESLYDSLI